MLTVFTALTTLGGCTAARWYLNRSSRRDSEYAGGQVKLRSRGKNLAHGWTRRIYP